MMNHSDFGVLYPIFRETQGLQYVFGRGSGSLTQAAAAAATKKATDGMLDLNRFSLDWVVSNLTLPSSAIAGNFQRCWTLGHWEASRFTFMGMGRKKWWPLDSAMRTGGACLNWAWQGAALQVQGPQWFSALYARNLRLAKPWLFEGLDAVDATWVGSKLRIPPKMIYDMIYIGWRYDTTRVLLQLMIYDNYICLLEHGRWSIIQLSDVIGETGWSHVASGEYPLESPVQLLWSLASRVANFGAGLSLQTYESRSKWLKTTLVLQFFFIRDVLETL